MAAGRGTRMRELTENLPKPILPVKSRPILEYTLENLPEEISEVIFIIGYKGDLIKSQFGGQFKNKKISYIEQKELNGTAGAIFLAKDFVAGKFLVLMGDDLYHRSDLEKLISNDLAILAKEVKHPERFGVLEVDEDDYLLEVVEKPTEYHTNLVNVGAYVLNKDFFNYDPVKISEKEYGLPQTLAKMAKDYKIKVVKADFWQPVGRPEDIIEAEKIIDQFSSHFK